MNEIFNIKRFGMLLQEDARSYFSKYIEVLVVPIASYLGVCVAYWIFSFLGYGEPISKQSSFAFMSIFFVVGFMRVPYILYGHTNHKKKGISYAMLPVSSLEKFSSMFLMVTIIAPIILLSSLILVDSILALLTIKTYIVSGVLDQLFSVDRLYLITLLSGTFLLGNVVFMKSKISKTILSIILFWIISVTIFTLIILGIVGADGWSMHLTREDFDNLLPFVRVLFKIIGYSIPAVLLFFTYRKIKTQQY